MNPLTSHTDRAKLANDKFAEMLIELGKEMGPPAKATCIALHLDSDAISINLDVSRSNYSEWIKGEGADICLYRDQETDKVVGCRLPLVFRDVIVDRLGRHEYEVLLDTREDP